jgi:nudix-type nucleoside diphosphatase (YffH/AdpP family)
MFASIEAARPFGFDASSPTARARAQQGEIMTSSSSSSFRPGADPGAASIDLVESETLWSGWGTLRRLTLDQRRRDGRMARLTREVYGRGDGAAVLPCDVGRRTVILVRQFRPPAWEREGTQALWEAPAGLLDDADPTARALAETQEETGVRLRAIEKLFEAWSSPGCFAEKMHYFLGFYAEEDRIGPGGGLAEEGEDIEVRELDFDQAFAMMGMGQIQDAKTIVLLQHARLTLFKDRSG